MFNITFQQIEAFLTVAKYMNLSKAAEAMFTSQSALSRTLRRFEEGVEMNLFHRSNQGLEFTEEGEYLCTTLGALYNGINNVIVAAQSLSYSKARTLSIAMPSSFDSSSVFQPFRARIAQFKLQYPDVLVRETLMDFRELRQALEFGSADLVFAHDFSVSDIENIRFKRLCSSRMYLAVSEHHPLAKRDMLAVGEPVNDVFLCVPVNESSPQKEHLEEQFRRMYMNPKRIEFVPNFPTLLHNVSEGNGVSLCVRFDQSPDRIKYVALPPEYDAEYTMGIAWLKDSLTEEARLFVDML